MKTILVTLIAAVVTLGTASAVSARGFAAHVSVHSVPHVAPHVTPHFTPHFTPEVHVIPHAIEPTFHSTPVEEHVPAMGGGSGRNNGHDNAVAGEPATPRPVPHGSEALRTNQFYWNWMWYRHGTTTGTAATTEQELIDNCKAGFEQADKPAVDGKAEDCPEAAHAEYVQNTQPEPQGDKEDNSFLLLLVGCVMVAGLAAALANPN